MPGEAAPRQTPTLLSVDALLGRAATDLAARFTGIYGIETVQRYLAEAYTALAAPATVTVHLPSLAVRFARERLTALAQAQGLLTKDVPEVLFVCSHNAGRSQLAAALLRHHAEGRVHVRSAGSAPAAEIDLAVQAALGEAGVELGEEFSKPLTDEVVAAADVVVTMGCHDACPVHPGKRYEDWDLPDPVGQPLDVVRGIRNDIDARVRALLDQLAPTPQEPR